MAAADLHIHSEYSPDGEWKVSDILNECVQNNISILSITDHNLVKGISQAIHDSHKYELKVIPGIEIDCNYKGIDLHVLGYNIDWKSGDFTVLEHQIAEDTMAVFGQMIENLRVLGIDIESSKVLAKADGRLPSPELMAEVLLGSEQYAANKKLLPYRKGGNRGDMPYLNFYLDYFAQGKPAYVKINYMDYTEAIELIQRNGGIPVVAHPGHNLSGHEGMVAELLDLGAEGLEVFNNYHTEKQIEFFAGIAVKRKIVMTCGSDFHGKNKPLIRMGEFKMPERYEGYVRESVEELLC